jgi:hypothetical protein
VLSLLDATEDRIREILLKINGRAVKRGELKGNKQSKKAENNNAKAADSDSEHMGLGHGVERTDEKKGASWPGGRARTASDRIALHKSGVILHPVFVVLVSLQALLYRRSSGGVGD